MNRMNEPARSLPHTSSKRFTNALTFSARAVDIVRAVANAVGDLNTSPGPG